MFDLLVCRVIVLVFFPAMWVLNLGGSNTVGFWSDSLCWCLDWVNFVFDCLHIVYTSIEYQIIIFYEFIKIARVFGHDEYDFHNLFYLSSVIAH